MVEDVRSVESGTTPLTMLAQQRHPRERLCAVRATVLLDVTVRLQVRAQVRAIGEGAATVLTRERLLPSVSANVTLK